MEYHQVLREIIISSQGSYTIDGDTYNYYNQPEIFTWSEIFIHVNFYPILMIICLYKEPMVTWAKIQSTEYF